jgi:hypothetical protein
MPLRRPYRYTWARPHVEKLFGPDPPPRFRPGGHLPRDLFHPASPWRYQEQDLVAQGGRQVRLEDFLREPEGARPTAWLVCGEPHMGRSTLLLRLAHLAREQEGGGGQRCAWTPIALAPPLPDFLDLSRPLLELILSSDAAANGSSAARIRRGLPRLPSGGRYLLLLDLLSPERLPDLGPVQGALANKLRALDQSSLAAIGAIVLAVPAAMGEQDLSAGVHAVLLQGIHPQRIGELLKGEGCDGVRRDVVAAALGERYNEILACPYLLEIVYKALRAEADYRLDGNEGPQLCSWLLQAWERRLGHEVRRPVLADLNDSGRALHRLLPARPARLVELPPFPPTRVFKGRDEDLARLDRAWADPHTNVLTIHAMGGAGKSSLAGYWSGRLARRDYDGAWVFGYSFEGTAGDYFIESALRKFGDDKPTAGNPEQRGRRLADLVRRQRSLLILDAFQAVQESDGKIRSPALAALVSSLAAHNPGLCLICTHRPVLDVSHLADTTAPTWELGHLSDEAGADLLEALGVRGSREERQQAAAEVRGHALALNLLGSYLYTIWDGDVSRRDQVAWLEEDEEQGGHARRIMASYKGYLREQRRPYLAMLRLISLFIRPAKIEAVEDLLERPVIPGLTDELVGLNRREWKRLVKFLRDNKLVFDAPPEGGLDLFDAHPLVREYFADTLPRDAFRAAHKRLYEHFRDSTLLPRPTTTELMSPLYLAVSHACRAEEFDHVLSSVYWPRIKHEKVDWADERRLKREKVSFNTRQLSAFPADLALLGGFYARQWDRLHDGVPPRWRPHLYYEAAFDLRALGRPEEAERPARAALDILLRDQDWTEAAEQAGDLSLLYITLGRLSEARDQARTAVDCADRGGSPFERVRQRTNLAHACLQVGDLAAAGQAFRDAETIVRVYQQTAAPERPPTLQSYWFYEVLLAQADYDRLEELLEGPRPTHSSTGISSLDEALKGTALARAWMGRAAGLPRAQAAGLLEEVAGLLDLARHHVEQAGTRHHQPRVLLARAALFRRRAELRAAAGEQDRADEDLTRANRELDEVLALAGRGMKVHLADALLESARLNLTRREPETARAFFRQAHDLVEELGYRRRTGEVEALRAALEGG